MKLEDALALTVYPAATLRLWREFERRADDLYDPELDLRIDAARMALLDASAHLDELILESGADPDLSAVEP